VISLRARTGVIEGIYCQKVMSFTSRNARSTTSSMSRGGPLACSSRWTRCLIIVTGDVAPCTLWFRYFQGIIPQSNILLAIGAAILLMNATRIWGSLFRNATAFCSSGVGGAFSDFFNHSCSQLDCWYFMMIFSATLSMIGYGWGGRALASMGRGKPGVG
jgi:hypothetical protein